jgi:transposase-like protein
VSGDPVEQSSDEFCLGPGKYLNNILEQDHRNVKRLTDAGLGFGSFWTARRTLAGYEAMAMVRKGQVRNIDGDDTAEVILWAIRRYLMFPINYRDLELMLLDRGLEVDHTTIYR